MLLTTILQYLRINNKNKKGRRKIKLLRWQRKMIRVNGSIRNKGRRKKIA